ncbi:hypothetical protein [Halanaeroarchaeum sulfurireducens]|uniref:HIT-type domain-containing protein n=1 Tax=Halanaeroarchaeum sulfurireducens TaxID=1604004 RepID=A0A0F7PFH2_9EURY|nr:hypothetical protein [Halanaeroarchaeum sulfurireducens]AKH98279.1 hypothetical protein HLASF_1808 [Halanaeroarchaeum sulfurireducens]ALG82673.1 hypothetical protein HLASA_1794 [Halanaeroarchaeum sulfurireducens]
MSVEGLCQICESEPARHVCERCGTLVCDAHYDRQTGLCVDCARSTGRSPDRDDGRFPTGTR